MSVPPEITSVIQALYSNSLYQVGTTQVTYSPLGLAIAELLGPSGTNNDVDKTIAYFKGTNSATLTTPDVTLTFLTPVANNSHVYETTINYGTNSYTGLLLLPSQFFPIVKMDNLHPTLISFTLTTSSGDQYLTGSLYTSTANAAATGTPSILPNSAPAPVAVAPVIQPRPVVVPQVTLVQGQPRVGRYAALQKQR